MRKYLVFLSIFLFTNAYSQHQISDINKANNLLTQGDSLSQNSKYKESIDFYYKASEIYKEHNLWKKYFRSLNNVAANYYVLKKVDKTIEISNEIIDKSISQLGNNNQEEAIARYLIGVSLAFELGKPDEGKEYLLKALSIQIVSKNKKTLKDLINTQIALGRIYDLKNDNVAALEHFQKSLNLAKLEFGEDNINLKRPLDFIGRLLVKQGNYKSGFEYFQKELSINKKNYGENHSKVAGSYIKLAIATRFMGNYKDALDYNLKALNIYRNKLGTENLHVGVTLNNIGFTLEQKGDYEEALKYLNESLKLFGQLLGKEHPRNAISYNNLGLVYYHQGKYNLSITNHNKALCIRKKSLNKHHPYITLSLNHLGDVYLAKKDYKKSLECYQKALFNNVSNFEDSLNVYSNPKMSNAHFDQLFLLTSLKGKANALSKSNNLKDLLFAEETYKLCDQLINKIRFSLKKQSDKVFLNKSINEVYSNAISVSYKLFEATDDDIYLENAFYFAEKNKAGVLSETIADLNAKMFSGIPDSLLQKENKLKNEIAYNLQKITSKPNSNNESIYRSKLFDLNREHEKLIQFLEKKYPNYYSLKYKNFTPSIKEIQKRLDDNTTMLEYFTDKYSVYAFVITKNSFTAQRIAVNNLVDDITKLVLELKNDQKSAFAKLSHNIYNELIDPLNISTDKLIIIPDGYLWKLNFDILLTENPKELDYKLFNYLIKDFTINYANSATILFQETNERFSNKRIEMLAFSLNKSEDSKIGDKINLQTFRDSKNSNLPGTRKEIKAISNIMEGDYFYGSSANEKNFKENAKNYNILHLALHGKIDNKDPLDSKLLFTQGKDSLEDNLLHIYELYNLELNAELAVLSACNTGQGKIVQGEGIISLGRAFTYAGCKSLVISKWEVSDAFTPEIMQKFYKNLKAGKNKSESLRNAKLTYLNNADNINSNPYYWASLVQIGNNHPLKTSNFIHKAIYTISCLIILGMLVHVFLKISKVTT